MGTTYEIVCLDCDEAGGVYIDRRVHAAEDVLTLSPVFAAAGEALLGVKDPPSDLRVEVNGNEVDLEFFRVHKGHDLHVLDGYGTVLGQCREWKADVVCCREDRHEGPCSPEGRYQRRKKKEE